MFLALNYSRVKKTNHRKSNFKNIIISACFLILGAIYITFSDGLAKYIASFFVLWTLLKIRPKLINETPHITIVMFENSTKNKNLGEFIVGIIVFCRLLDFHRIFVSNLDFGKYYSPLDNININLFFIEIIFILFLRKVSNLAFTLHVYELKKNKITLLEILQYIIFFFFIAVLFLSRWMSDVELFKDFLLYLILNFFAFHKQISKILLKNRKWKEIPIFIIEFGFAMFAFWSLNVIENQKPTRKFYKTPLFFFICAKIYFSITKIIKFYKNRQEITKFQIMESEIEDYCLKNGKIRQTYSLGEKEIEKLKVVELIKMFSTNEKQVEEYENYLLVFLNKLVIPTFTFLVEKRWTVFFLLEICLNLLILMQDSIQTDLLNIIVWIYFFSSICFKRKRKNFMKIIVFLYICSILFHCYSVFLSIFFEENESKIQQIIKSRIIENSLMSSFSLLRFIQFFIFVLIQGNYLRKTKPQKLTDEEIRQKMSSRAANQSVREKVVICVLKILMYIFNIALFCISLQGLLNGLDYMNLIFIILIFYSIFQNSDNFKRVFYYMMVYQSLRYFMTLVKKIVL